MTLIIFDLDGVITSEEAYWDAAGLTLHEMLYSPHYWGLQRNQGGDKPMMSQGGDKPRPYPTTDEIPNSVQGTGGACPRPGPLLIPFRGRAGLAPALVLHGIAISLAHPPTTLHKPQPRAAT